MNTQRKILNLLNRKAYTVNELAKALGVSRNAAHLQVTKLEAQGLVVKKEQRQGQGVGKPAYEFHTAPGKEDVFSTAYKPMMDMFVEVMGADLPLENRRRLFEKVGRSLAIKEGLQPSGMSKPDLEKALSAINTFGALAELTCESSKSLVSCHSCPVATLAHSEPLTCNLVAAFFSEATGKEVAVKCNREERVVCGFEIQN